jgi:hypothetical protein
MYIDLYNRLLKNSPHGILYSDAVQLFLWLFCSNSILPAEFKEYVLDKGELADLFSRLAVDKMIVGSPSDNITPENSPQHASHWIALVKKMLSGEINLDNSYRPKAERLLRE